MICSTLALSLGLAAQTPAVQETEPPPPGSIYTLHVYTNLIQMPTLVIDSQNHPITGLTRDKFRLTLDGGPIFHPTQMHREDAEPLMMAFLLDASGSEPELVQRAPEVLASLASKALTPRDGMAIFAFDCHLSGQRTITAIQPDAIRDSVRQVLANPHLHESGQRKPGCPHSSQLIDSIATSITAIQGLSTRRVLVVLSDGFDRASKHKWDEVVHFAGSTSTAVFVVRTGSSMPLPYEVVDRRESINNLTSLSMSSGGLMLTAPAEDLRKTLEQIVTLLRSRYVLQFPRANNSTAGLHRIDVKVAARDAIALPTGANSPLASDDERNGENTVQGDHSQDPVLGNHAPKQPKR